MSDKENRLSVGVAQRSEANADETRKDLMMRVAQQPDRPLPPGTMHP